jgi:hypothetical protein
MEEFNNEEETMKKVTMLFAIMVVLAFAISSSFGSEDHDYHHEYGHEHSHEYSHEHNYESRFYGTITKIPADYIGNWIVNNKEVQVTEKTHFSEKHGKAEVGAYVEVEGRNVGNVFEAYEIEVKRAKK